jgi:hypothetical protein
MRFVLRRYLLGIAVRRNYLWLALLPAVVYVIVSALKPDLFLVTQQLAVDVEAPFVVPGDPLGFQRFERIVADGRFFEDPSAMRDLRNRLQIEGTAIRESLEKLPEHLFLRMMSDGRAEIAYRGADPRFGRRVVEFYAARLVALSEEGNLRVTSQPRRKAVEAGVRPDAPPARPIGTVDVEAHRRIWRGERMVPLLWTLLGSLLMVAILLCIAEWRDPSFKSERQVARYLSAPVLGSVPDLGPLVERLYRSERPS